MVKRSNVLADIRAVFRWLCHFIPWCQKHTHFAEDSVRKVKESEAERARLAAQVIGVNMMVQSRKRN